MRMRVRKELKTLRFPKNERIKKLYQKKTTQKCKVCVTYSLSSGTTYSVEKGGGRHLWEGACASPIHPTGQRPLHGGEFHVTKTSAIEELCNY